MVARLAREGEVPRPAAARSLKGMRIGPWSALHLQPDRRIVADLSMRHALRGADLWHLALAKTLAGELPELAVLTFDSRLAESAREEGLSVG